MMRFSVNPLLGAPSILFVFLLYRAAVDIQQTLSPQGCRMSWMSPSYILQDAFNTSRSPLANRYSLWLYREVGWDSTEPRGAPVLFIPGNAGSSHQVRSIASSATRQFYSEPHVVAPDFESRSLKPLDFFGVEFDEDLSALHGRTIESQVAYTSDAISYILSLYPPNTSIIVMGHSMGGVVATALLPSPNISAIITMSTPHTLAPARVDSRINKIYAYNQRILLSDPTPILSICGGATDNMIPSESCILPSPDNQHVEIYRSSVFTSALEGAWSGVGHREMVWCHQVRWRIAKAALELGEPTVTDKGSILDRWIRDGHKLPPDFASANAITKDILLTNPDVYEALSVDVRLVLKNPRNSRMYLLPVISSPSPSAFVLFVSQGSIPPVSPQNPLPLRVSIYLCATAVQAEDDVPKCRTLLPTTLRLVPNPVPGQLFPLPNEGSDESEGVVVFEAYIPSPTHSEEKRWVGVLVEDGDGRGWIVAGMNARKDVTYDAGVLGPVLGSVSLSVSDPRALMMRIYFPNLWSSVLVVYRLTTNDRVSSSCSEYLLAPLLAHTSDPPEAHYFPFASSRSNPILLHTHSSAPYISSLRPNQKRGLNLTIYTSGCDSDVLLFDLRIDWWATMGRFSTRYPTTLGCWAVGVVALVMFGACKKGDQGLLIPSVYESLNTFATTTLPKVLLLSAVISVFPLPKQFYLGDGGDPLLLPLAPLLVLFATSLVWLSWWVLTSLILAIKKVWSLFCGNRNESINTPRSLIVMCLILIFVFVFLPWQATYLGCWITHLFTCAKFGRPPFPGSTPSLVTTPTETPKSLVESNPGSNGDDNHDLQARSLAYHDGYAQSPYRERNNEHYNMHILLLMTWLLPLAAPALAVWVRTLSAAGLTAPFDGDNIFLNGAPFVALVYFASWRNGPLYGRHKFERKLSVRWLFVVLAFVAFFIGPSKAYVVLDVAKVCVGLVVAMRVIPHSSRELR